MARTMGNYCKAYLLSDLRSYPQWNERADAVRSGPLVDDGDNAPRALADSDIVYIQENFVVTHGIFKNENVVFDAVDPDWIEFCEQQLKFAIPEDVIRAYPQQVAGAHS